MNKPPVKNSNTKTYIILALVFLSMIGFGIFAYQKSKASHAHADGEVHSH